MPGGRNNNNNKGRKKKKKIMDGDDDEDEDYHGGYNQSPDMNSGTPNLRRISTRRAAAKNKLTKYDEYDALDRYLEEEEKGRDARKQDQYKEKIEKLLEKKCIFIDPKTKTEYAHKHEAPKDAVSTLVESTKYLVKIDGVSYLHLEWMNEDEMFHRFGKHRASRRIMSLEKNLETMRRQSEMLWGGEPFNPDFKEVDRILDCLDLELDTGKQRKYFVKWKGLSYSQATWETYEDIDNIHKINEFERFNTPPQDMRGM